VVKRGKKQVKTTILEALDQKISGYYEINKDYPALILMSKEIKDKVFEALETEPKIDLCWTGKKDNYRGIEIQIKKDTFLELK
jgi:hypothetical protein